MTSWFLTESNGEKLSKSIFNYLSLGQFELARSLIGVYIPENGSESDSESDEPNSIIDSLARLVKFGPPDDWVCSSSVPSTAHLLCMCCDVLRGQFVAIDNRVKCRIDFDCMLAITVMEVVCGSGQLLSTDRANEIRVRYVHKLIEEDSAISFTLPRLLILCGTGTLVVLPGSQQSKRKEVDFQFSSDLNEFLFKVSLAAPNTSPGLLELLHEVSPLTSAQLTHIQAASVASCLVVGDWKQVCMYLRFLNEQGNLDVLTTAPLLTDLMSLLVFVINIANGIGFAQKKETVSMIHRLIQECLSTSFGSFPFVSKKRKSVFSLSHLAASGRRFAPNERLRLSFFESLSTRSQVGESLLEVACKLEDALLSKYCELSQVPPCFDEHFPIPFWDGYVDFVRMAQVHALGYPLETAVGLIKQREFAKANEILTHFNQLRPLAIFLCWDGFGHDIESRSCIFETLWPPYLEHSDSKAAPIVIENAVWSIYRRFESALLISQFSKDTHPGTIIDVMDRLGDHSLIQVLRSVITSLESSTVVPAVENLPPASTRESPTNEWLEAEFDMDVLKSYFVLRATLSMVTTQSDSHHATEIDHLCSSIKRVDIKVMVLRTILTYCFSTLSIQGKAPSGRFIVTLGSFFSLVCLVCGQASQHDDDEDMRMLLVHSQKILAAFIIRLKESVWLNNKLLKPQELLSTVSDWSSLVSGDPVLASRCDELISKSPLWRLFPRVNLGQDPMCEFISPPRDNLQLVPDKFIPRIATMEDDDQIHTALAMNDFCLAQSLLTFLSLHADSVIDDSRCFDACRRLVRSRSDCVGPQWIPETLQGLDRARFLIDLAVCGRASSDVSLRMLREANGICLSADPNSKVNLWSSKLAVLLEAKTEFSSNVSSEETPVTLSELILGIETLPTEPELLKDHLNRMHSQRSAIMALVNRVDQVRRGQVREEGNVTDFLAEAISRLTTEETGGIASGGPFLIRFLEYLGRACALVQGASPTAVSFFDILSVEPIDLVAGLVFKHSGFTEASSLCELMHMDLISVVQSQSCPLQCPDPSAKYFISLEILRQLPNCEKCVVLCVERRTECWPSSDVLDYAISICDNPRLKLWIQERKTCWDKFVTSFKAMFNKDVSVGFTIGEERLLDQESKDALESVAKSTQTGMEALTRMVAKAFMKQGLHIAALEALDEGLSSHDDPLCKEALMGCLTVNSHSLSSERIYELLWRLEDSSELLRLTMGFIKEWESGVALRALRLCSYRLKENDRSEVDHLTKVIETMSTVAKSLGSRKWDSWQRLAAISSSSDCIEVISDLISRHKHSLACEFLDLKSECISENRGELDVEADRIELSRLKYIFLSKKSEELLDRFQRFHHPLKASSLAMRLMASIDNIVERSRLGRFLVSNRIACDEDGERLETQIAALALLRLTESETIRPEWSALLERPDLIFESLLLNGKSHGIADFLDRFPSWRNDDLVILLARRALGLESGRASSVQTDANVDKGLGGIWMLCGQATVDQITREIHCFDKIPDMPLVLRFVSLLSSETESNAERIFAFADQLSRFLHTFSPEGPQLVGNKCPFKRYDYLRQAILALLAFLQRSFPNAARPELLKAVEFGSENIKLIGELWQKCKLVVGLRDLSSCASQCLIRDTLIELDALDLAERVCYAAGKETIEAQEAADVVTLQRSVLLLKLNRNDQAVLNLDLNLNGTKKLSRDQLGLLENAVRSKPRVTLGDIRMALDVLLTQEMDKRVFPTLDRRDLVDSVSLTQSVKSLLLPFDNREIRGYVIPSHSRGELSESCSTCCSSTIIDDDFSSDVCISSSAISQIDTPTKGQQKSSTCLSDSDLENVLNLFEKFGSSAIDSIGLLLREGRVETAIERVFQNVAEENVVTALAQVLDDSTLSSVTWVDVLHALGRSKEPPSRIVQYLSTIERHLRQTGQFGHVYAFEVSMGKEAQAGIVAVQLYLRSESWESRLGWLDSASRHLSSALSHKASRRFAQRQRLRRQQLKGEATSSEDEEEEITRQDERRKFLLSELRISVPFTLSSGDVLSEQSVLSTKILVEMERDAVKFLPNAPCSASLFGSIQAVSELIDYLLMEGHVGLAKSIITRLKLPDSVLCGIFGS